MHSSKGDAGVGRCARQLQLIRPSQFNSAQNAKNDPKSHPISREIQANQPKLAEIKGKPSRRRLLKLFFMLIPLADWPLRQHPDFCKPAIITPAALANDFECVGGWNRV